MAVLSPRGKVNQSRRLSPGIVCCMLPLPYREKKTATRNVCTCMTRTRQERFENDLLLYVNQAKSKRARRRNTRVR